MNGKSVGMKQRKSADFPAAGLHWKVKLNEGENKLRAVGKRGGCSSHRFNRSNAALSLGGTGILMPVASEPGCEITA